MKKSRFIIYIFSFIFAMLLVGCKTEPFAISASITSVSAAQNEISFYATIECSRMVEANAILEKEGNLVSKLDSIVINKTTKYTFDSLDANTEYVLTLQYKTESDSFVRLAREEIKTLPFPTRDIVIQCSDLETIFDGTIKTLSATTNVPDLSLNYKYTLNGNRIENPIHPGEYDVDISFAGNEVYNPCSIRKKLIIKKADIKIECEDLEVTYDGAAKYLLATTNVPGIFLSYTYYLKDEIVDLPKDAGTYKVIISFAGNEDYNACRIERNLTINPRPVDIAASNFKVIYGEEYKIGLDIAYSYGLEYYQGEVLLEGKPVLPGEYYALITLTEKNYCGSKKVFFEIEKLEYLLSFEDSSYLLGEEVIFLVDDFVIVEYYLNQEKVEDFSSIGQYTVKFVIKNHAIYKDMEYRIQVIIDTKKHIILSENEFFVEYTYDFKIKYHLNFDVEVEISYLLNNQPIPKPTQPGIYQIKFNYAEDSKYVSFEKTCSLVLYPSQDLIENLEEGVIFTKGTVLAQDDFYSYVVDQGHVLYVKDLSLTIGETYEIVGILEFVASAPIVEILKIEKTSLLKQTPNRVSLIHYEDKIDEYLHQYICLTGIVIEKQNKYYLVIDERFALPLGTGYSSYVEKKKPLEINIITIGQNYILISDGEGSFTREEELYKEAYFYRFPDITTTLPREIKNTDIRIEYLESSNLNIIHPETLSVFQTNVDVTVTVKVNLILDEFCVVKSYSVLVLKKEIEELKIYSIEMHQQYGDSVLIVYGDYEILIDAGDKKDGEYVNKFLKEHISKDNHLDMIIVTHCHSDHMGGLAYASGESRNSVKALDGIESIGKIIDYGHDRSTNALHNSWVEIRNSYIKKGTEYYPVYDCAKNTNGARSHHQISESLSLDFIDTMTYALPSDNKGSTDLNIYSVATLLTYNDFKFFFAGDLEDAGEYNLYNHIENTPLKDIKEEDIVLYKAAHHGTDPGKSGQATMSKNGGNQLPFLKKLKPDYFFASAAMCSGDNFGTTSKFIGGQPHPYPKCLANFLYFNDNVYFNGTNGTLEFVTDGFEMNRIHGFGATTQYLVEGTSISYDTQMDLKLIDTLWYQAYRKKDVDAALDKIKYL